MELTIRVLEKSRFFVTFLTCFTFVLILRLRIGRDRHLVEIGQAHAFLSSFSLFFTVRCQKSPIQHDLHSFRRVNSQNALLLIGRTQTWLEDEFHLIPFLLRQSADMNGENKLSL